MKLYVLVFNDYMGTQESVTAFLDSRKEVLNWCTVVPHSILIVSEKSLADLTQLFSTTYPGRYFLLSEIQGFTSNGILQKSVWDFINNPKSSGRWQ